MTELVRILMPMKAGPNLGRTDRVVRLLVCLLLLALTLTVNSHVDHPGTFALLSIFFYTTALLSWDPFYDFLGISTHIVAAPQTSSIEKVTQAGATTPVKPLLLKPLFLHSVGKGLSQYADFRTEAA